MISFQFNYKYRTDLKFHMYNMYVHNLLNKIAHTLWLQWGVFTRLWECYIQEWAHCTEKYDNEGFTVNCKIVLGRSIANNFSRVVGIRHSSDEMQFEIQVYFVHWRRVTISGENSSHKELWNQSLEAGKQAASSRMLPEKSGFQIFMSYKYYLHTAFIFLLY